MVLTEKTIESRRAIAYGISLGAFTLFALVLLFSDIWLFSLVYFVYAIYRLWKLSFAVQNVVLLAKTHKLDLNQFAIEYVIEFSIFFTEVFVLRFLASKLDVLLVSTKPKAEVKVSGKSIEVPVEKSVEKSAEKPADKPVERPTERVPESPGRSSYYITKSRPLR